MNRRARRNGTDNRTVLNQWSSMDAHDDEAAWLACILYQASSSACPEGRRGLAVCRHRVVRQHRVCKERAPRASLNFINQPRCAVSLRLSTAAGRTTLFARCLNTRRGRCFAKRFFGLPRHLPCSQQTIEYNIRTAALSLNLKCWSFSSAHSTVESARSLRNKIRSKYLSDWNVLRTHVHLTIRPGQKSSERAESGEMRYKQQNKDKKGSSVPHTAFPSDHHQTTKCKVVGTTAGSFILTENSKSSTAFYPSMQNWPSLWDQPIKRM